MAYVSALLVMALAAVALGLLASPRVMGPKPGRVLGTGTTAWERDWPGLREAMFPGPEEPSPAEWEEALPYLEEAVAADPEDATARRQLALAYYNLRRLDEAQAIYETMLAAQEDPLIRNRLGNILRDQGDLRAAEAAYRQAISGDPQRSDPYMNLAELLWRTHRDAEAVAVLRQGMEASPESRPLLQRALELIGGARGAQTSS